MKVSVIISVAPNREELFEKSLYTYNNQKFDKKDFEIILIDDNHHNNMLEICKQYNKKYKIKFKYIKIDNSKSYYTVASFTPALTNNIGFRLADGEVILLTGPETLQYEYNIHNSYLLNSKKECSYGIVYKASEKFNKYIKNINLKNESFVNLLKLPGAKDSCLTMPPHPPAYWYCMAVKKEYIYQIRGVDERFLGGICGEDDDFSNRMKMNGIIPKFNINILGIHQNHYNMDKDKVHNIRKTEKWNILRKNNINIIKENLFNKKTLVNENHTWGDTKLITEKIILT